jgi:hypothetical protein
MLTLMPTSNVKLPIKVAASEMLAPSLGVVQQPRNNANQSQSRLRLVPDMTNID